MKPTERKLLQDCATALIDWEIRYAPELFNDEQVKKSRKRVYDSGGWLAYTSDLLDRIRKAVKK